MRCCTRYCVLALTIPAVLIAPVLAAAAVAEVKVQPLTLLHTSDLHGCLLPFDDLSGRPATGSLAHAAALIKRIRNEVSHPVLLFDSGDTIQGTPLELFANVRWQGDSPIISGMNLVGYQAMAVGNHELNFGLAVLRRAEKLARFPLLSANTINQATGKPTFTPYVVLTAAQVRVGVLGLTTAAIPTWERAEHYQGLRFEPPHEVAPRWVKLLREQEGCDLVVVLAHTGFERDPESGAALGDEEANFAWRLSRVAGIDLLLTGHEHQDLSPFKLDQVIVSQPLARGRVVTRIDLELVKDHQGWQIRSWQGTNLSTAHQVPDAELVAPFAKIHAKVVSALDGPVGEVTRPISVDGCLRTDCAASELIHEVQLQASGAQLSLAAMLSTRTPDLAAGPVTWRWIHGLYVYPNTLVAVQLSGAQLEDVLEHAARYYTGMSCRSASDCRVSFDQQIPLYNADSMAGVSYRIYPNQPVGDRVRELRYQGQAIDPAALFTVVGNSYRMTGGGDFPHLAEARRVWQSSTEMTELIADFLGQHSPWTPTVDGNWRLVAEQPEP